MHNAALAALGIDWRYLAFNVRPEVLGLAIAGAKATGMIGVNLTVPHKLLAVDLVDVLDKSASTWGAVNTVRFEGQASDAEWLPLRCFDEAPAKVRAHGFNTDAEGIILSLREDLGFTVPDTKILLLGAGGAGRTAALRLAAEGPREICLVNRTAQKAEELGQEIRTRYPSVRINIGYPRGTIDLVLNATSLGLKPEDPLPFDPRSLSLSDAKAAYDMVYRPAETAFLAAAKQAGCGVANGLGMLLYQGARALELWTGVPAPISVMRSALETNVYGSSEVS
jgi:shikimate dehydrogenase